MYLTLKIVAFACVLTCADALRISSPRLSESVSRDSPTEITVDGTIFDIADFSSTDVGPGLELSKGSQVQMPRILMLYTTSGTNAHMEAFCLNMQMLAREATPLALKSASILLVDNGGIADADEGIQLNAKPKNKDAKNLIPPEERRDNYRSCFDFAHDAKKKLYMSAHNVGYNMGAIQAVDTVFQAHLLDDYDWVIHQHPDVYMIYPDMVFNSLATKSAAVCDNIYNGCWHFDWFAFRPNAIQREAFHRHEQYQGSPECYLRDNVFNNTEVKVLVRKSKGGYRGIDQAGIMHSHEPKKVRKILG